MDKLSVFHYHTIVRTLPSPYTFGLAGRASVVLPTGRLGPGVAFLLHSGLGRLLRQDLLLAQGR